MYTPVHFRASGSAPLDALLRDYPFAVLITWVGEAQHISHLPLLRDGDRLLGHLAVANPHAAELGGGVSTAIFNGPHGYISPRWYGEGARPVPTWNYAVAHISGLTQRLSSEETDALLERLVATYEPASLPSLSPAERQANLRAIVGFSIQMDDVQVKLKMSQNRSSAQRASAVEALKTSGRSNDGVLAQWMQHHV